MYRLSGVVSAPPSSAAAAVTRMFGWVSSSGLIVRCSVDSLTMVHAIAVNCAAASASVIGAQRCGVDGSMRMVAGSSVAGSPTYSRTTIDEASAGIGTHWPCRGRRAAARRPRTPASNDPESSIEIGVADVAGHAARGQARAREHLEAEVGGACRAFRSPGRRGRRGSSPAGIGRRGSGPPIIRVSEHMSKNCGRSGSAWTDSSAHSPVTLATTARPSISSRSSIASSVTVWVRSARICWTNCQDSRVFGAECVANGAPW